jgi:hypothetical protein
MRERRTQRSKCSWGCPAARLPGDWLAGRLTGGVDEVDQEVVSLAVGLKALQALLAHLVVQRDAGGPAGRGGTGKKARKEERIKGRRAAERFVQCMPLNRVRGQMPGACCS